MRLPRLLLMLTLCATGCNESTKSEGRSRTETQLRFFGMALDTFAEDCGRYPSSSEGLAGLLRRPDDVPEALWKGPYLDSDSIPVDRWGRDYVYSFPGTHNTNRFDLYSYGPDGTSKSAGNDPDDINNWDSERR